MSQGSFVLVLLLAACRLLTGDNQLLIAAQIADEFLCQDLIRIPSLMVSHVRDELNSSSSNAGRTFAGEVLAEEVFSGDEYSSGDEEQVLLRDAYARDPGRFVDEEEEDEEDLSLSGQDVDVEASNNLEEHASRAGDVQCPECGKHFKNDKSMFGHLRSHPDRGYKGANPPAKPKLQLPDRDVASPGSSSPVDSRSVIRYSQRDPRLDTYEVLAAYVMLTIKYRDNQATQQDPASPSHPCSKRRHEAVELDVHAEDSAMSEAGPDALLRGEHGSSVSEIAGGDAVLLNKYGSFAVEVARADAVPRDEHGNRTIEVLRKRGRKKSKEGREAHNKEKDVQSVKEKRPYTCKHCNAEFTTHQALGGHMAAHNKDKRIQAQSEQAAGKAYQRGKIDPRLRGEAYQWKIDRSLGGEAHQGKIDRSLSGHEAKGDDDERGRDGLSLPSRELLMEHFSKMFNKGLQSRQEPGGYMSHYIERKGGGSLPVPAASKADGDRRRSFDIDLNVQAPEQE